MRLHGQLRENGNVCFDVWRFFSALNHAQVLHPLAVRNVAFTISIVTGMRGAAGGRQPAEAKLPLYQVYSTIPGERFVHSG